jgi:hypothetical protein
MYFVVGNCVAFASVVDSEQINGSLYGFEVNNNPCIVAFSLAFEGYIDTYLIYIAAKRST